MNRRALLFIAALAVCFSLGAQQSKTPEKELPGHALRWDPPYVDFPISTVSPTPPCNLAEVLQQAGTRADEMIGNLQNFSAQEKLQYEDLDQYNVPLDSSAGDFDYAAAFEHHPGGLQIQESRSPVKGTIDFPASNRDVGTAALALIFHPSLQGDYEMTCEGADQWDGTPAWVVHFQQRKDKRARSLRFATDKAKYPAQLKGRAWIAMDSLQVLHLETDLIKGIAMMGLRNNAIRVDYAPVQFHSQNVQLWLPQTAEVYSDFGTHRTIFRHTFTNFLVFSVQTKQVIEKPKAPQ